jgi:hypothetical protein
MTTWNLLAANLFAGVSLCLAQFAGAAAHADTGDDYRLSGPAVHGNLAIYFVHGKSRSGPVPLTLAEALAKKTIVVRELGQVNELQVENTGNEEIFIQSGDIVKGGQQDRVLSVSLVLQPHSGPISIASFCVEQGRWSARGGEDVAKFSSANASLPSRAAKIQLTAAASPQTGGADVSKRQSEIWKSVSEIQGKLSRNLGAPVAAAASRSSLQLALENGGLERAQAEYVKALQPLGEKDDDIVGYVFAVNGKLSSADIYPSNGLFRKMWPKLLVACATEAITEHGGKGDPVPPPPPVTEASGFLVTPHDAPSVERNVGSGGSIEVRDSTRTLFMEAKPAAAPSAWVHRNYLAK